MTKIYQELEQIFKFRIYNNGEIKSYLKKLSLMGKIDEVKKQAMLILILHKLGEMEDEKELLLPRAGLAYLMPDVPERREGALTPAVKDDTHYVMPETPNVNGDYIAKAVFDCSHCDFVAKTAFGLKSHSRKHINKV